MSVDRPTYDELKAKCEGLQQQITRFSVVEQDLVNTRDSLDRELARFKAIESFTKRAIHATSLREFAVITVESVIEAFEVECSALFTYDKAGNSLKVSAALGIGEFEAEYPLDMDWMAARGLLKEGACAFIEQPYPKDPWGSLGLCQVIYTPYYGNGGDLRGFVLGGRSARKQVYYDEIKEELIPSFTVFAQQMSTLLHKLESHEYLERRVREQTAELIAANAKLTKANEYLQREITERKRAEEALRESGKRLRAITNTATDAIVLMDNDGKISYWNSAAEKTFGYRSNEVLGKELHLFLAPQEFYDIYKKRFREFKKTGEGPAAGKTLELTAIKKDGTKFPIEVSVSSMEISGKWHAAGIIRDITKRKKMEEELFRVQKLESIGVLAGGIAHDFNNILMGIQGYASLMLMGIDSSHPHYDQLQGIKKQVQSGARLTSQLLGYARKGKYEVKPVSLNRLVEETSETFGRTRKEITIHRALHQDLFAIEADRGQIEQVLLNLYVNAAAAMPGGGSLILKTMNTTHEDIKGDVYDPKSGNCVLLTVTDTGIGMDKKTQKRIFEPFFTTKEMGRGTGLGLASVYGIIKAHSGYIDVESEKGHGTTFSIYFPATEKKVQKSDETTEQFIKETSTVLLVDDEEIILEVGKEMLEAVGYRVLTARSGKEAVEIYKKYSSKIDIILLDMIMPGMNGGEVYDRIKETNPDIKVLLSSGYSIDGQATEILERGCNAFIQKPFDMNELSGKIMEILEKK